MRKHLSRALEADLRKLREQVSRMGGLVEATVSTAVSSFTHRDPALARTACGAEFLIDGHELAIDRSCIDLLARRYPIAGDLRLAAAVLKISKDLERMGDLAVNVCERAADLPVSPSPEVAVALEAVAVQAKALVRRALDAFTTRDAEGARWVIAHAGQVNPRERVLQETIGRESGGDIPDVTQMLGICIIAGYLEDIAYHAASIAEMVVFTVEGRRPPHRDPVRWPIDALGREPNGSHPDR
jgi:phosphate transport system protein